MLGACPAIVSYKSRIPSCSCGTRNASGHNRLSTAPYWERLEDRRMIPIGNPPAQAGEIDLSTLPRRVDRKIGSALVTQHFFPTTPRSLEDWPVTWRMINGKAVGETAELFAVAQAKLEAAAVIP